MSDILRTINYFHQDGTTFELCSIRPKRTKSGSWEGYVTGGKKGVVAGWFNDKAKAADLAGTLDAIGADGIYVTLNQCNDALLSRASNRLKAGIDRTQDKEILMLRWLLVDIDPKRPSGVSSTDQEHNFAIEHALWIKKTLAGKGWPEPLYADSGNGAHLVYRLPDLENNSENIELLSNVLTALNSLYLVNKDGITLDIDTKVFNPSRISKLYGTRTQKGDHTAERPHRISKIISIPETVSPLKTDLLKEIIELAQKDQPAPASTPRKDRPAPRKADAKFDIEAYIAKYGVAVTGTKQNGDSILHVLETCLFDSSHSGGEAAIGQTAEGKLFYQCFHDSCKGKTWQDAKILISGESNLAEFSGSYMRTREPPKFTREELTVRIDGTDDFEELTNIIARDVALSGLPKSSIAKLQKTIAKKCGIPVSALKADAKEFKNIMADSGCLHLEAAREVINFFGQENILMAQNSAWFWNGCGVWKPLEDREIKQKIHVIAESDQLTKNTVDSILDLTKTEIFRPNHIFDNNPRCINVQNGELHFINAKWELHPHSRENYRTTQLPVDFNPEAKAPRFLKFLDEIFRDDLDKEEKKQIILEGFGYSILTSCEFEKFFLLIGPGSNGKSVLMDTLASLVGQNHVCAVQPSQFENKFQRAHLWGKLVNLVTEIAEGHEIADAQLKAIVSGELTTAEHKHKPPFDFRPFATCWFGTNHMPHTRDFSDALFRRAIILNFERIFKEEDQDKNLKNKLKAELSGILNLALSSMIRLVKRGYFTQAPSVEIAKQEWRMNCDQVAQFAEDRCELGAGPEFNVTSASIYERYLTWSKEVGIRKILNRKNFTLRLKRLGVELGKGTGGARELFGIRFLY